jgi:hypothetical protein
MGKDLFGVAAPYRDYNNPVNVILLAMDIGTGALLIGAWIHVLVDRKRPIRTKAIVGLAAIGCCLSLVFDVWYRYDPDSPPIVAWLNQFMTLVSVELVVMFFNTRYSLRWSCLR